MDDRVEAVANQLAKAIQKARDEIGATEQQRVAFAYAEAAMRSELPAALSHIPDEKREEVEPPRWTSAVTLRPKSPDKRTAFQKFIGVLPEMELADERLTEE